MVSNDNSGVRGGEAVLAVNHGGGLVHPGEEGPAAGEGLRSKGGGDGGTPGFQSVVRVQFIGKSQRSLVSLNPQRVTRGGG